MQSPLHKNDTQNYAIKQPMSARIACRIEEEEGGEKVVGRMFEKKQKRILQNRFLQEEEDEGLMHMAPAHHHRNTGRMSSGDTLAAMGRPLAELLLVHGSPRTTFAQGEEMQDHRCC